MRRTLTPLAIPATLAILIVVACQSTPALPAQPVNPGPPAIPDAQPAVDAPLFVGQNAFAAPLANQVDFSPPMVTVRSDGGNSGVVDGPAPLGRAPVTGSAAVPVQPPLLWGRRGLTAGCQVELGPGFVKPCLAAVDTSTFTVEARWLPPGQDLNLASAVLDDADRVLITTRQGHLFVVTRPDSDGAPFRVVRDIDLNGHLSAGQSLLATVADADGNLWFTSGAPPVSAPPAIDTVVGFVTSDDQVVTATLADQRAETGLTVDQGNVYLVTAPARAADLNGARGAVYDLTAAGGRVETAWRQSYDAGSSVTPGATPRGTASPVVLVGSQYLALTDNSDAQSHLLVYLRGALPGSAGRGGAGPTSPTGVTTPGPGAAPTTTPGATSPSPLTGVPPTAGDPRLVCRVALFNPGASAVTISPIGYSSAEANSLVVANGYNAPLPLSNPSDGGPANNMNQMAPGLTRIDVLPDGSGCRTQWTTQLRLKTAPVLSTTTGLIYGYTQDEARAGAGSYVWYFVAVDYRSGRIIWRQRGGAGSTKNDNGQPTIVGANGVLYQTLPLGLVWMRDVAQRP